MKSVRSWKQNLKQMKLESIKKQSPEFFEQSGGFRMSIIPYKDNTANGLTKCIIDFLNFQGWYANRINVQGQARKERIKLAHGNFFDKVTYTPSTTNKGTADISAIVKGQHWSIEVKVHKDRMSLHQLKEMERVTAAGGKYFIARSMDEFLEFYNKQITTVSNLKTA